MVTYGLGNEGYVEKKRVTVLQYPTEIKKL